MPLGLLLLQVGYRDVPPAAALSLSTACCPSKAAAAARRCCSCPSTSAAAPLLLMPPLPQLLLPPPPPPPPLLLLPLLLHCRNRFCRCRRCLPTTAASTDAAAQARYESEAAATFATARLWDDGVIDPADTRRVLGLAFGAAANAGPPPHSSFGVFRM